MTRKLEKQKECFIDDYIYICIIDKLTSIFHYLNVSPNFVTLISVVFGFLSIYYLYKRNFTLFVVNFYLYYILDLTDGYYARKYNLCSKFGDYFDHTRDLIIWSGIIYILVQLINKNKTPSHLIIIIVSFVLFLMHMSCQEKNFVNTTKECHSETLNFINLCPGKEYIYYTKYFGMGTFSVIIVGLIYLNLRLSKKVMNK
jgi:phosphatidylglycerophosphate synthase